MLHVRSLIFQGICIMEVHVCTYSACTGSHMKTKIFSVQDLQYKAKITSYHNCSKPLSSSMCTVFQYLEQSKFWHDQAILFSAGNYWVKCHLLIGWHVHVWLRYSSSCHLLSKHLLHPVGRWYKWRHKIAMSLGWKVVTSIGHLLATTKKCFDKSLHYYTFCLIKDGV